ncbi:hypothetical protein ACSBR2_038961 [Camellia fascicularis]
MSWLILLHQFLLFLSFSQVLTCSSSWSSSTSTHPTCLEDQRFALLQLKKTFVISVFTFLQCKSYSHPKMEFWNESTDCCAGLEVMCGWLNGHVIGLDLSCSELQGTIQTNSSLFHLRQLQTLNLAFNHVRFSRISSKFGSLMNLTHLNLSNFLFSDLSNNKIGGEVPKWVFDVGKNSLKDLDLSNNFLTGLEKLPWQTLQFIDLHSNLLHGPLPIPPITTIAFSISNNKLTGEIFPLICSLNLLKVLDLSNNNFSGIIPHCFGNFSNSLSVLNFGMNSFHGTFTTEFTVGNMLRNLNLNGNHIEGQVLRSLLNCEHLEVLDLGINKINDIFPDWLGTLLELQTKSKVPFTKLRIIDISYNEFSGLWPTNYIEKFDAMMNVDEHAMKLKYMGDIYCYDYVVVIMKGHEIEFSRIVTIISIIDLSSNKFIGEILKSIGRLNSLQDLNLSHSNLKGHIPTSLGNLKSLESLDLSSNKLTSLMFLEVLNLSVNQLVWPIPQGSQFNKLKKDSYSGNLALCGFPLSKKCQNNEEDAN